MITLKSCQIFDNIGQLQHSESISIIISSNRSADKFWAFEISVNREMNKEFKRFIVIKQTMMP